MDRIGPWKVVEPLGERVFLVREGIDAVARVLDPAGPPLPPHWAQRWNDLRRVVKVIEVLPVEDTVAIVMEKAPGRSLDQLESPDVIDLLDRVRSRLRALHDDGITHGSLSPRRIFVDGDDVWLTPGVPGHTHIDYAAPEVFDGKWLPAGDLYALALIAWELSTGERACRGTTVIEKAMFHMDGARLDLERIPADLAARIRPMLAKDPDERGLAPPKPPEPRLRPCLSIMHPDDFARMQARRDEAVEPCLQVMREPDDNDDEPWVGPCLNVARGGGETSLDRLGTRLKLLARGVLPRDLADRLLGKDD